MIKATEPDLPAERKKLFIAHLNTCKSKGKLKARVCEIFLRSWIYDKLTTVTIYRRQLMVEGTAREKSLKPAA